MNKELVEIKFKEIISKLNEEQQEAVNTIFGPVMVIAGPGTGKTQILSARIGNILLKTDYLAENILCLTYTDAGRIAMRERLQTMIGADAYRVAIHTFHSFCNQVIQENANYFKKNALDAISEIEQVDLLKELISNFSDENPLKRYKGDIYYEISRLKELFSTMKKEYWTPEIITEKVEWYLKNILEDKSNKEFYYQKKYKENAAGDPKNHAIKEVKRKMTMLLAAANSYYDFQKMMHENNRYDFDDMILWVIDVFKNNPAILSNYQEQFQFVLVDEYQDTNGSQNEIINLMINYDDKPNIFVVGDDDQSVYRFQGANFENIVDFQTSYLASLKEIMLKKNYRSNQQILDLSKALIENNTERIEMSGAKNVKILEAANDEKIKSKTTPQFHVYQNSLQEMIGIVMKIDAQLKNKELPQSIAVLYSENKYGDELIKMFKEKNIPFYNKRKENLFDIPLAKKIFRIAEYIASETDLPNSGNDILFEILHFDLFEIPAYEISKMVLMLNEEKSAELKYTKSFRLFIQKIIQETPSTLFATKPNEKIISLIDKLEKLITSNFNNTVINVFEEIIQQFGFLAYALKSDDKIWHLEVLYSLMDFVKSECHRKPNNTISSLLELMDTMKSQNIIIPLYRLSGEEKGVNLLTAHSSKGLEFKTVYLCNVLKNKWEAKSNKNTGYTIPAEFFKSTKEQDSKERILEEKRRLFYVAVTRAEENLFISWSKKDEAEKVLESSQFIQEIKDKIDIETIPQFVDENNMSDYLEALLMKTKKPILLESEKEFVQTKLKNFKLSPTALNNYLHCPLAFYYQNIIKVPSGKSESSTFGSAVHWAIEKCFEEMLESDEKVFPSVEKVCDFFEWYINRNKEAFAKNRIKDYLVYGKKILTGFYNLKIQEWNDNKIISVERRFSGLTIENVPVSGMLDKIIFNGNDVTIVDYKTGKVENAKPKLKAPNLEKDEHDIGGDYWRQGIFYKLMVDNYNLKEWHVTKTIFELLEPENDDYFSAEIIPSHQDEQIVKNQLKDTWAKIQAHDFYTGCGKNDCNWCNFTKDNSLQIDFAQDEENVEYE